MSVEQKAGPFCLRYPRDTAPDDAPAVYDVQAPRHASWDVLRRGKDVAILAKRVWTSAQ